MLDFYAHLKYISLYFSLLTDSDRLRKKAMIRIHQQ